MKDKRVCIDVSDFDIEKKKRVQDAFFKLGFKWKLGGYNYRHLDEEVYTNTHSGSENHCGFIVYGNLSTLENGEEYQVTYDELMEMTRMNVNARDKIYTGKVSEWGLPDGTVMIDDSGCNIRTVNSKCIKLDGMINVGMDYKIKSLPDGYEFNDDGEIVKVDSKESDKRYWKKGKSPEIGEWFMAHDGCHYQVGLVNGNDVAYRYSDYRIVTIEVNEMREIDTRTDKEKAVDDLCTVSNGLMSSDGKLPLDLIDAIVDGKIHGVKWVGNDE